MPSINSRLTSASAASYDWGASVKVTASTSPLVSADPANGLWVPQNSDVDEAGDLHQYLPDAWENPQEQELNNRLPAGQPQIELVIGTDAEPRDPDGAGPADNHAVAGDGLTAWQEYRAYSCNCHTTTRLDAWEKELLAEIDIMGAGERPDGSQYNPPTVADVLATAIRARSMAFPNLYIDFHYKVDETAAEYRAFNSIQELDDYDNAHKDINNYGQYVHTILADEHQTWWFWAGVSWQFFGSYLFVSTLRRASEHFNLLFSDIASCTLSHEIGHCIFLEHLPEQAEFERFIMYQRTTREKVLNIWFHPDLDMPLVDLPGRWIGGP